MFFVSWSSTLYYQVYTAATQRTLQIHQDVKRPTKHVVILWTHKKRKKCPSYVYIYSWNSYKMENYCYPFPPTMQPNPQKKNYEYGKWKIIRGLLFMCFLWYYDKSFFFTSSSSAWQDHITVTGAFRFYVIVSVLWIPFVSTVISYVYDTECPRRAEMLRI